MTCDAGTLICLGQGLRFAYDVTYKEDDKAEVLDGKVVVVDEETIGGAITSLSWSIESNVTTTTSKYHEQTNASTAGTVIEDSHVQKDVPVCTIEIAGAVLKEGTSDENALVELFEDAAKLQTCAAFEATDQCGASGLEGVAGNAYVSSFGITGETDDTVNWKATLVTVGEIIAPVGPPA